jgi:Uma2 family endonuclease
MRTSTAYRVSVSKFDRMCASGLFEDEKVELLGGILTMMTTGPAHDNAVTSLHDQLRDMLPRDRWTVRDQMPVHLGMFWKPMPDIAVVRGPRPDFANRTPRRIDIALIVEVSDTTYATDTGRKLRRYERCGLALYWIVDLSRRRVEVREMGVKGLSVPVYFQEHEEVPIVLDGRSYGRVVVRDLLP